MKPIVILRFLPFFALYYFHSQKDALENEIETTKSYGALEEWYGALSKKVKLTFLMLLVPVGLVLAAPSALSLIVLLAAASAWHNYSELYLGMRLESKLKEVRNGLAERPEGSPSVVSKGL